MERIAIISDIHGNLEALKRVLQDIKERDVNKIICLGDIIAKGKHSRECIDLIKNHCDIVIQGNCDYFYSEFNPNKEEVGENIKYNRSLLTDDDITYLKSLPFCYEIKVSGNLVRCLHSTPENIAGFVGDYDTIPNHYRMFLPSEKTISQKKADVIIYGHIHKAFMKKLYHRTLLNTGSVGNSFEVIRNKEKDGDEENTTRANYLIISGKINSDSKEDLSYEFISLKYDIKKEIDDSFDVYEKEELYNELMHGLYRDMDKIEDSFRKRGIDPKEI